MSRMHRVSSVALAVILGTGCGGGEADNTGVSDQSAAGATATSDTTTTMAADTTTSTSEATTTSSTEPPPTGCADAELPDDAERLSTYDFDLDDDGADDTVTVFYDASSGATGNHGLFAEYASGGSARVDRPIFAVRQALEPFGLFDVNDDGTPELFVVEYPIEQGISYEPGAINRVIVVGVDECALFTTTHEDRPSDPAGMVFSVSTHPPQGGQLRCEDGAMVHFDFYQDASGDSSAFRVGVLSATLTAGMWTQDLGAMRSEDIPKDEMLARPLFECGDLQLPPPIPPA